VTKPVTNIGPQRQSWRVPRNPTKSGQRPVSAPRTSQFRSSKWYFSFQYWKQIKNFGLDGKNPAWFISLIERLRDVSSEVLDKFFGDGLRQEAFHYHKIKWDQTNIPIKRTDLIWLPKDYLDNDAEFPIVQFSIRTALGRVAGFWDENRIFNVILIDPNHNLQPVKENGYNVVECYQLLNEHEILLAGLSRVQNIAVNCSGGSCATKTALRFINSDHQPFGIVYLEQSFYQKAQEFIKSGKANSMEELLELGILIKDSEPEKSK
jgi:hypothetical protein